MASQYHLTIIGGGIIGLATALKVLEIYPRTKLLILEKETQLARHQTGNNSGVIHSGLYYRPGSLKARSCVTGRKALIEFCDENAVPYELCGKVVVATSQEERPRLEELYRRGVANGLRGLEIISAERLKELEPHAVGIRGLHVPETGIIDYKKVAEAYAGRIRTAGGDIRLSQRVLGIIEGSQEIVLQTSGGDYRTNYLINCCGLHSDVVANMIKTRDGAGSGDEHRIIPFRGEYYKIAPARQFLVRNLIYPVPDPTFPFLGVHFTRMAKGGVEAGPNAVLALAREGYRHTQINPGDLWRIVSFKGFWAMTGKYWQTGFGELYRSLNKSAFVRALQKLLPEIRESDLVPGGAGVRAQAVSASGALVDDFVIKESRNAVHVLNAPSPGATASLAIGQAITDMAAKNFGLKN
ncbi:MAG TPA: L-2-hydroxyglutarate oxidase [Candidatus Binatia bacterium]|nr:L-2-hydroxyglutarate oxidase [Candidatus Binatia bacterium]